MGKFLRHNFNVLLLGSHTTLSTKNCGSMSTPLLCVYQVSKKSETVFHFSCWSHPNVSEFEKRDNFAHFGFKTLISLEPIATMNFKPGRNILSSSYYTTLTAICEPRLLPVWSGRAHASIAFEKRRFMPLFGGSPLGTGLLGLLRWICEVEGPNC